MQFTLTLLLGWATCVVFAGTSLTLHSNCCTLSVSSKNLCLQQSRTRGPSTVYLLSSRTGSEPRLIGNAGDVKCRYLFQCARTDIQESHSNFWSSVENSIEFVITRPNGWEGQQQQQQQQQVTG
ncbi:hypothetical protein DEU56DRAFT_390061 [Suillus clintonianus]|uniref:uncharacterized protein n=1 Tax=Suillus clintonianus TaxID=1904413 RepID=UPI001B85D1FE|nr:uncharacterized protein DEU56DRAFT_390061 [Suillus clintonianus]KAG2135825.1 hypothetical protein DEU56DRAFT_390061 [Suillus clintonianus]